jgi:hypothetical protein
MKIRISSMAHLFPTSLPDLRRDLGVYREHDVIDRLADSLPDGFEVYHSIPLHSMRNGRDQYGELDIVILSPTGAVLLAEVKAGALVERNGTLIKLYGSGECDVRRQSRLHGHAFLGRLRNAGIMAPVVSCLVLPDYTLSSAAPASLAGERIIDAGKFDDMGSLMRQWLLAAGDAHGEIEAVRQVLRNEFSVTPDVSVLSGQLRDTVRRLSDGLASWVPRIHAPSGIVHVKATAGSGKTQLALQLLQDCGAGARAGYVCYNRALADRVRQLAPARSKVATFHELCTQAYTRQHGTPDFSEAGLFERMTAAYLAATSAQPPRYDLLVIDEAQDLHPDWIECLCGMLRPDGRLYVLDDDDQRLYATHGFDLADAVVVRCTDNYRTPRTLCDVIGALKLAAAPIRSMNPYWGTMPEFLSYRDARSLKENVVAAVTTLLEQGYALADIAVITARGRERSVLLGLDQIGPWQTRRFSGDYDANSEPVWTDGDLLIESIYRFKGLSAPAIVAVEFDFDELDERNRRKLFVALTRARMTATVVLSTRAEACLATLLGN